MLGKKERGGEVIPLSFLSTTFPWAEGENPQLAFCFIFSRTRACRESPWRAWTSTQASPWRICSSNTLPTRQERSAVAGGAESSAAKRSAVVRGRKFGCKTQKWSDKKCEADGSSRSRNLGQFSHKEPFLSARPVLCQPGKKGVLLPGGGPKIRLPNAKMVG